MSEYRYYEFQAIDRPLDPTAQQALRSISSRARITATSFTNHYEWGDLKGDPRKFMERWFDLHLYLANWGSRRLMIRLPKRLFRREDIDPFLREVDWVEVGISADNLIVDIHRDEVELDDWDNGSGWLAALAPLRSDVLSGDLRLFYLLWLTAVQDDLVSDTELERLPGIGPLTGALEGFAEFFGVDPDLVQAAAESGAGDAAISKTICARQWQQLRSRKRRSSCCALSRAMAMSARSSSAGFMRNAQARRRHSVRLAHCDDGRVRSETRTNAQRMNAEKRSGTATPRKPRKRAAPGSRRSSSAAKRSGAKSRMKSVAAMHRATSGRHAFFPISRCSPRRREAKTISVVVSPPSARGTRGRGSSSHG